MFHVRCVLPKPKHEGKYVGKVGWLLSAAPDQTFHTLRPAHVFQTAVPCLLNGC
jgi:hypothetical protein